MLFNISISFPESKIQRKIPIKSKVLATIIPGDMRTYIFNNEHDYYHDYQKSYFAFTKKKQGWDCLRHYEILANGCIPIFEDLEECPPQIMTHLPKKLLLEAKEFYYNNPFPDINNKDKIEKWLDHYHSLANQLLDYTHNNLSTKAMANYVLKKTNFDTINNPKILFLNGLTPFAIYPDYVRCLTLHGFKDLFKQNCHDYPCVNHLYTDYGDATQLYGKGITYSNLLDKNTYRNPNLDNTIEDDIRNHRYDIIIYGSLHRGKPFFNLVNQFYQKNEIIMLCGEDLHGKCHSFDFARDGYNIFVREILYEGVDRVFRDNHVEE